ncbi:hypothetical protein HYS50_01125 [Candidatus Woesearchaeota archaeon]|nr:hypothetical protein [Candidatus Woesearchaeota archaeon]
MHKILLDTDFLLQCIRWKVDLFGELERLFLDSNIRICVFDRTLQELAGKKDSQLALAFTKKMDIITTGSDKPADDLLLEYGHEPNTAVATQDRALKEKLKKAGMPVITIRKQRYLVLL